MAYINSIYNAGNDYPQFLTKIVRIPPSPIYTVNIVIDINGTKMTITASGETSKIVKYKLTFKSNNTIIKTVYIQPNTEEYDLTSDGKGLGVQFYNLTIMAYDENGNVIGISESEEWYNIIPLPECEPMTLRFRFSKTDYSPVDEDAGTSVTDRGTWTKVESGSENENLWDFTYDNPDWNRMFQFAFTFDDNIVDVVQAGDMSGLTNAEKMFRAYSTDHSVIPSLISYVRSVCWFDTSNVTDMDNMFMKCKLMKSVPKFNMSNVTDMSSMFLECSSLTSIPPFDTSKVEDFNQAFARCTSIESIELLHTESAQNFRSLFQGCSNLKSVKLGNTSKVTDMSAVFQDCISLDTLPYIDISSALTIKALFRCCPITDGPELDTSSVTNFNGMFGGCTKLVNVPTYDMRNCITSVSMFDGCIALENIPDFDFGNAVTKCQEMFKDCVNIKTGILSTYEKLSAISTITNHKDTFLNCGINTDNGLHELGYVPSDWGGRLNIPDGLITITENPDGTKSATLASTYKQAGKLVIPNEIVVNHVEFNRKFTKGAISTVVVPVDVNTEDNPDFTFYSNFYVKVIHNEETGEDEDNLAFVKVSGIIPRNTPMAIISNVDDGVLTWPDGEYIISTEPNRDIVSTMPQTGDKVSFKAVYEYTVYTEEMLNQGHTYYGFAASPSESPSGGDINTGDLVRVGANAWMAPFRMVIDIEKKE